MLSGVFLVNRIEAATNIQRHARGYLGRRKALLYRKIANAVYFEKGQNILHFILRRRLLRVGATLVLQKMIAKSSGRKHRRAVRALQRITARRVIQRRVVGWYERIRVAKIKVLKTAAGLDIQRVYRGHVGRCIYRKAEHERLLQRSAIKIQRIVRGYLARCFVSARKKEANAAAVFVQRVYRGQRGRRAFSLKVAQNMLTKKKDYLESVTGRVDNARFGLESRCERETLRRQVELIQETHVEWGRRTASMKELHRVTRLKYKKALEKMNSSVSERMRGDRKLIGVTENVYTANKELYENTIRQDTMEKELQEIMSSIMEFKFLLRSNIRDKRMLEPQEFWDCALTSQIFSHAFTAAPDTNVE